MFSQGYARLQGPVADLLVSRHFHRVSLHCMKMKRADAVAQVRAGKSVVIDARILRGYVKEMAEGMTAEQDG